MTIETERSIGDRPDYSPYHGKRATTRENSMAARRVPAVRAAWRSAGWVLAGRDGPLQLRRQLDGPVLHRGSPHSPAGTCCSHDPWLQKGWSKYQDAPKLRYRRILVPGLAWLLAAGQSRYIDAAYNSVILFSLFFGIYWLSRYAVFHGRSPAWGLGFLLVPGTLISIDRLTVDIALVALCSGLVWYVRKDSPGRIYLVLVLAGLARETGLLLTGACCLHALWNRRWRQAMVYATAALPALLWYGFVATHAAPMHASRGGLVPRWFFQYPLVGILMKLFQPEHYPFGPLLARGIQALDAIALGGLLLALGLAVWGLRKGRWDQEHWATLAFLALTLAVSTPGFWRNVYSYARPFSPLVFLVGLRALSGGSLWALAPILMMDLRVAAQWAPQLWGVLRGLL
jgi:hypothetical protein